MMRLLRVALPLVVLAACLALALYLVKTGPKPQRKQSKPMIPVVEVMAVRPADYRVEVRSQGTVLPRTQSTLVSEVGGRITGVSANFRNGGFFAEDEVLVEIDPAEYQLAVDNLRASLAGVEARLAELEISAGNLQESLVIERQQLALAERQFRRLGKLREQGTVAQSALDDSEREYLQRRAALQDMQNRVRLVPAQRSSLNAELRLKQSQLDAALLDLERTRVRAPFEGRLLEKTADVGQSVSKGSHLATIYAVDYVEVRLPITDRDAAFLQLPGPQAGMAEEMALPEVAFSAEVGGALQRWQGRIVRSEGSIDTRTRQLFLVAQVIDPFASAREGGPPLRVGQFVEAGIPGRMLERVYVLPRRAVRADDEVLVVGSDGRIERRRLKVIWRDRESVVAGEGLNAGERISLTSLPYAPDGSEVRVKGEGGKPAAPPAPGRDGS